MFTTNDGRGRQIARNLTIAVLSAGLAGSGAAWATDSGGTQAPTKRTAHAADCVKPDQDKPDRGPLSPDEPIVRDARTRLQALVTAGQAQQGEVDAVLREVIAGSVNLEALVQAGTLTASHVDAIDAVLKDIKNSHAADKPPAAAAAAKEARGI